MSLTPEDVAVADLQRLLHMHYCGTSLDLPKPDHPDSPATKCWAVARILAVREAAAVQAALAESALDGLRDHLGRSGERAAAAQALIDEGGRRVAERVEAVLLASDDGTEYEHTGGHSLHGGEPECPGCWVATVRAALRQNQP